MDSNINWLHLPDIIWESILNNLKGKDLLKATETCEHFNSLLSRSQHLMNKFCLQIMNPYANYYIRNKNGRKRLYRKYLWELKYMKECLQKTEKK